MDSPSNACCDSDEKVHLLACCSKCPYEWVLFGDFFIVGGVWKSLLTVDELYELYDI